METRKTNEQAYQLGIPTEYGYWVLGYSWELWNNPAKFITNYLYPIASQQGYAIAPAFSPVLAAIVNIPQIVVIGPHDQAALQRLFQWGEYKDDHENARDRMSTLVAAATGAPKEYLFPNHRKQVAADERHKFKQGLNNIEEVFTVTQQFVTNIMKNWQPSYSYQHNMRYIVTNIVAICVFGIPHVPIEAMGIFEEINHVLAYHEPEDPEFKKASQALQTFSDQLIDKYGAAIIRSKKFLASQLNENQGINEGIKKLREIKAGSSLLVENNLSNTIMIALECIMRDKTIKDKLRAELSTAQIDFNKVDDSEQFNKKINNLPYFKKIYMEALRFVNPGVMTVRQTNRVTNWTVKDRSGTPQHFTVNANSHLFAPLRMMGQDETIWHEPEKFNPDRFTGEEKTFSQYGSYPFMLGNRSCPAASSFAKQVFYLVIGGVVQNYDFTLSDQMKPIPANSMHPVLNPEMKMTSYTHTSAGAMSALRR